MESEILVVDDDPAVLKVMIKLLEAFGHKTISASSGNEAMKLLESPNNIHFIITDMRMPLGDGLELLSFIKKSNLKIPTILVTGFADIAEHEAIEKGAIAILTKPFDIDKLMDLIDRNTKV